MRSKVFLLQTILACLCVGQRVGAEGYAIQTLDVSSRVLHLHWGQRGTGGRFGLFALTRSSVRIWEQSGVGFSEQPQEEILLPTEPSLVDFADVCGDGAEEIVLLNRKGLFVETRSIRSGSTSTTELVDGAFTRILVVSGVPVGLETAPSAFLKDVTGDGLIDLIAPVRSGYEIYRRSGEKLEKLVSLEGEHRVTVDSGGPSVLDPLRFELNIPQLKFKDLNGDGLLDLLSRMREKTRCYLQGPQGFPAQPTYELDLARFREGDTGGDKAKGPSKKPRRTGISLGGGIKVHEVDIDSDGVQDYLIAAGQFLRVYFGAKTGTDFSRPHTMLKLSNELQGVGSFDIDGDGRLDLVAVKFELPSLPKLIAAYFVSMSLDFEVLGYKNEGGRKFSRRPDWRNALALELPPLREVIEGFDAFADRFLDAASRKGRFAAGDLNSDGLADAAFLDSDHILRAFHGRAGEPTPGRVRLGNLLFDTKKSHWELQELLDFVANASLEQARRTVEGRTADLTLSVGEDYDAREVRLRILDLDGDKLGDIVIECGNGKVRVALSSVRREFDRRD